MAKMVNAYSKNVSMLGGLSMDYSWYISPQEYKQAKKNGICRSTLEDRIRQRGWSKRKANRIIEEDFLIS